MSNFSLKVSRISIINKTGNFEWFNSVKEKLNGKRVIIIDHKVP